MARTLVAVPILRRLVGERAAKHAGRDARVTVALRHDDTVLAFSIEDTGHGFDPRTSSNGAGLTNVKDRIDAVGGTVDIRTRVGHGTTVTCLVPWPPRAVA